jgi:hypothetical protein
VTHFVDTPAGDVPSITHAWGLQDWLGTAFARLGVTRNNYAVSPGLYAMGNPDANSPVIVTANYKLTFDAVRGDLAGQNLWMVVLDTRGINVWCAAGKNLFSTAEVIKQLQRVRLDRVVKHRRIILPQLGAPGVSAKEVRSATGFSVVYGPVLSADLPAFLESGMQATTEMRTVRFPLKERAVLIPVEIMLLWKTLLLAFAVMFVLSGIGPDIFSFSAAVGRLAPFAWATLFGVLAGQVAVPVLLPVLPFRAFAANGALTGGVAVLLMLACAWPLATWLELVVLAAWTPCLGSFLAMNFSGSTPYTSPTGVEWEMRRAVPLQILTVAVCLCLWVAAAFIG